MENDEVSKDWVRFVDALRAYIKDYDAHVFPETIGGKEANFQASLFHELIKDNNYPYVNLEATVCGFKPDIVLGKSAQIVCEIKMTSSERKITGDLKKAEQYLDEAAISVVVANCQYPASGGLKQYLDNNNYEELPYEDMSKRPTSRGYYMTDEFDFVNHRGLYVIVNVRN